MPLDDLIGPPGGQGVLQVIPEAQLQAQEQQRLLMAQQAAESVRPALNATSLCAFIKTRFEIFRNHRNTASGWTERLLSSFRTFNGQYDNTQLNEIRKFGGSEIYARIISQK